MHLTLNGRHALVCGASRGIGLAAATELAQLGANVTLLARSADALTTAAANLPRIHPDQQHDWRSVDMLDTVEAFETAFRQHLLANQTLLQALLPAMRASGYGRIVNVISTSVKEPIAGLGVSNTVRAAVASWAKTLAGELAAEGITVNNVLPGYTHTQRLDSLLAGRAAASGCSVEDVAAEILSDVPAGRFGEATEIAAVIAFLCTPAAAYVNGVSIAVDGGRTRALS